jgi:hypothetical protein
MATPLYHFHPTWPEAVIGIVAALVLYSARSEDPAGPLLLACMIGGIYALYHHVYVPAAILALFAFVILAIRAGSRT